MRRTFLILHRLIVEVIVLTTVVELLFAVTAIGIVTATVSRAAWCYIAGVFATTVTVAATIADYNSPLLDFKLFMVTGKYLLNLLLKNMKKWKSQCFYISSYSG